MFVINNIFQSVSVCQLFLITILHRILSPRSRKTEGSKLRKEIIPKNSKISLLKVTKSFIIQQLAALLIARQVISNLKESAIPYIIEQLRLARLSFELFGALSPSEARSPPVGKEEDKNREKQEPIVPESEEKEEVKGKQPRNVSQAELESSLYRVGPANSLLSDVTFKV